MTQALAQARKALEAARLFIAAEYADASAEIYGEWLASEARPVFAEICRALADMETAGDVGHGPYGYLLKPIGLNEEHWTLSNEPSEYPDEVVSVPLFALGDPALAAIDAALEGGAVPKDGDSHRTVFAWAWTLFGNGSIWLRALTWTKDDPFAVEVANPNFTSVAVPLYTDEELSAALPSALDLPSPPTGA